MGTQQRNHVIDLARASGITVVVIFHALLYQIRLDAHGVPTVVPWQPSHAWWPVTWPLMPIPIFFIAGGFAHALLVDRFQAQGRTYAYFLANRGRRLVGPLVVFVTVCALLATMIGWLGYLDPAITFSRQLMQLLWFITVYLAIVFAAPALVRWQARAGWLGFVPFIVLALAVDAWSFAVGDPQIRNINMLLVWPFAHQLGVAYHRGAFRRGALWRPWAAVAGGVLAIVVMVFGLHYPGPSVGFPDIPYANVQPPTTAMAALALAQVGVIALVDRSGVLDRPPARFEQALAVVNALMMTIYLWHIPLIFLAGGVLLAVSMALPALSSALLFQGTVAWAALALVAGLAPLIGRLEYQLIPPLGERQAQLPAITAFGLMLAGTATVWLNGTVLHPAAPASTIGVLAIWTGAWLMAHAANWGEPPV